MSVTDAKKCWDTSSWPKADQSGYIDSFLIISKYNRVWEMLLNKAGKGFYQETPASKRESTTGNIRANSCPTLTTCFKKSQKLVLKRHSRENLSPWFCQIRKKQRNPCLFFLWLCERTLRIRDQVSRYSFSQMLLLSEQKDFSSVTIWSDIVFNGEQEGKEERKGKRQTEERSLSISFLDLILLKRNF